jgi:hypothetical protein
MSSMNRAYRLAALAVRRRLAEQRPAALAALTAIRAGQAAVHSGPAGSYDHVERVLGELGVPWAMQPDLSSVPAPILFVNCSNSYGEGTAARLADYVAAGGWLVSSDWALGRLLQDAFPGTVRWTGRSTRDQVIGVEPGLESVWAETVVPGADPQWWLEASSHPIEVLSPGRVRVEAASHQLLIDHDAPAVAVSFSWEKGEVYHVMSHFWHQRSRTPGARHRGPCTDFLAAGMQLSAAASEEVLRQAELGAEGPDLRRDPERGHRYRAGGAALRAGSRVRRCRPRPSATE